jgi:hypothetical protein
VPAHLTWPCHCPLCVQQDTATVTVQSRYCGAHDNALALRLRNLNPAEQHHGKNVTQTVPHMCTKRDASYCRVFRPSLRAEMHVAG